MRLSKCAAPHRLRDKIGQKPSNLRSVLKCMRPAYVIDCLLSVIGTMIVLSTLGAIKLAIRILKSIG